jgi:hypothetical protein
MNVPATFQRLEVFTLLALRILLQLRKVIRDLFRINLPDTPGMNQLLGGIYFVNDRHTAEGTQGNSNRRRRVDTQTLELIPLVSVIQRAPKAGANESHSVANHPFHILFLRTLPGSAYQDEVCECSQSSSGDQIQPLPLNPFW